MNQAVGTQPSSLLLTLEDISHLISHSHDPGETLNNIVTLIQGRMHAEVCSVYLLESERKELVLGATVGLSPQSVGQVRMRFEEGLTGLVAERLAPVMEEEASNHPRFKYFPEAGEDPYHSFLGVPLIETGTLQGVLVVQTKESRRFSPDEVRMLVAVGTQLAPLVSEAQLLEAVSAFARAHDRLAMPADSTSGEWSESTTLDGVSLSPGIGVGEAYLVNDAGGWTEEVNDGPADPVIEAERLDRAFEAARAEITRLSRRISDIIGENHGAILQAQLLILQDRNILREVTGYLKEGFLAETALARTLEKYVAAFQKLTNPVFQERVYDIKDVGRHVLWHLRNRSSTSAAEGQRLVLVTPEASVLDLFAVDPDRLAGVVFERGGPQCHAAILARSLHIPMVGQAPGVLGRIKPGQTLLVDGTSGRVELSPTEAEISRAEPVGASPLPQAAANGVKLAPGLPRVEANINLLCEVEQALVARVPGIGLYRTEFLFLARRTLPTEEEQYGIYRRLLDRLNGRPVSIRTFDLRPDKLAQCAHVSPGAAHLFDWRRILDSPPLQKLFKDQIRAILRAGCEGQVRLLIPLVTRTEQLDLVHTTIEESEAELKREGLAYRESVPLGIMIETAAAVTQVPDWAPRVDFIALGTNDLIASALGIDRDDPVGASADDMLHPGVIRLIRSAIVGAHQADRPVTVCGEMASDPAGIVVLSSLGIDACSVAVDRVSQVREVLTSLDASSLSRLSGQLATVRTVREVRELVLPWMVAAAQNDPAGLAMVPQSTLDPARSRS